MAANDSIVTDHSAPIRRLDRSAAMSDIDRLAAFCRGAVTTIQNSEWETDRDAVDTVYLLEAALELAEKLREQIDPDSVAVHHG